MPGTRRSTHLSLTILFALVALAGAANGAAERGLVAARTGAGGTPRLRDEVVRCEYGVEYERTRHGLPPVPER